MDRLGLPTKGVETIMIEISGGKFRLPFGREPPRAIVEAFACDVDIVAVEHAVDEPCGKVGGGEGGGRLADEVEQPKCVLPLVRRRLFSVQMFQAVARQRLQIVDLAEE